MGKDGEERFRNQEKQGKHKWCCEYTSEYTSEYTIMASRGNKRMLLYGAFSHVFSISYIISCKNDRWLFHSEPQIMLMAQNQNKKCFLSGKTTDMQEKKLKTLLCMV